MNIKPLINNVIIKRIKKEEVSSGGIVLPGGDRDEADRALVEAIGPDVTDVKVGDTVLVNWQKAPKIEGELYKVIMEDIIGIFE
jgi:co-chaperonin GroES (HSP10)